MKKYTPEEIAAFETELRISRPEDIPVPWYTKLSPAGVAFLDSHPGLKEALSKRYSNRVNISIALYMQRRLKERGALSASNVETVFKMAAY